MNFNIYLDDETGQRLKQAAKDAGETRNAMIRRAVSEWLAHRDSPRWPDALLDFQGLPEMPPFEAGRDHLPAPASDPLA
jgi:hypothetical protein